MRGSSFQADPTVTWHWSNKTSVDLNVGWHELYSTCKPLHCELCVGSSCLTAMSRKGIYRWWSTFRSLTSAVIMLQITAFSLCYKGCQSSLCNMWRQRSLWYIGRQPFCATNAVRRLYAAYDVSTLYATHDVTWHQGSLCYTWADFDWAARVTRVTDYQSNIRDHLLTWPFLT